MCELNDVLRGVEQSRTAYLVEEYILYQFGYDEDNCVLLQVVDTVYPDSVKTPAILDNCVDPPHDELKSDLPFSEVEKQGG